MAKKRKGNDMVLAHIPHSRLGGNANVVWMDRKKAKKMGAWFRE